MSTMEDPDHWLALPFPFLYGIAFLDPNYKVRHGSFCVFLLGTDFIRVGMSLCL
jgi:hypothetical protein